MPEKRFEWGKEETPYTEEEMQEKFPEITRQVKELKGILDYFNSEEAKRTAPNKLIRAELHYKPVKGTYLKQQGVDPTASMHIGEAIRQRYVDLLATSRTTSDYHFSKDPEAQRITNEGWEFLLDLYSGGDMLRLRDKLEQEINQKIEQLKELSSEEK